MEVFSLQQKLPLEQIIGAFMPIVVHWIYAGVYGFLGSNSMDNYRLHSRKDEDENNVVSKFSVIKGVLLVQFSQAFVSLFILAVTGDSSDGTTKTSTSSPLKIAFQFITAMIVLDAWQYFMHRYMHYNKFLYRHVHSQHHRLIVPYAYGASYNHPLEGLFDTIGGIITFLVSGMTPRTSTFFFCLVTIKTVDDHCGLWLPRNVFQLFFYNNTAYHDVHHQLHGIKYNFSQPFFVVWDRILGTYMPYEIAPRKSGGFQSRPLKEKAVKDH